MAGAATTVAAATGTRAWLGAHRPSWLSAERLRSVTIALALAAVLGAGLGLG
jgi:hypothetical protein